MIFNELTFGGSHRIAQIRYAKDDGTFHRECRNPGADLSDLPDYVREKIAAEWTPELIAAYEEATKEITADAPAPEPTAKQVRSRLDVLAVEMTLLTAAVAKLEAAAETPIAKRT